MQTNLEQIILDVRGLPFEDLDRLRDVIDEEKTRKRNGVAKTDALEAGVAGFKKSEKWLAENREEYMGQWVCLDGDILVAHGGDALAVDRQARDAGIKAPFLEHIVEEKYPFGGW